MTVALFTTIAELGLLLLRFLLDPTRSKSKQLEGDVNREEFANAVKHGDALLMARDLSELLKQAKLRRLKRRSDPSKN